jgi:hypothetical protein
MLYVLAISASKLSALFFYIRIFTSSRVLGLAKIMMGVIAAWTVLSISGIFAQCIPLSDLWTPGREGHCDNRKATVYLPGCGIAIATDVAILVLPIPSILGLKTKTSDKVGLICLFTLGIL